MELRIEFYKRGMIKFISHLDTIRLFSRAMKRAKIPMLWSEGYNPHMKMSIAVPLSLGMESDSETMDIEVEDTYQWKNLMDDLNQTLPNGLQITKVTNEFNRQSVFERVFSSEYDLFFPDKYSPEIEKIDEAISDFLKTDEVLVPRKRKKGKKRILVNENIRDKVIDLGLEDVDWGYKIKAHLMAGSENNLRPDRLLKGIFIFLDAEMDHDLVQIRRLRSYDKNGAEIQL